MDVFLLLRSISNQIFEYIRDQEQVYILIGESNKSFKRLFLTRYSRKWLVVCNQPVYYWFQYDWLFQFFSKNGKFVFENKWLKMITSNDSMVIINQIEVFWSQSRYRCQTTTNEILFFKFLHRNWTFSGEDKSLLVTFSMFLWRSSERRIFSKKMWLF